MKKILMYRWRAYNYLDIKEYFERHDYEVTEIYQHLESYDVEPEFAERLRGILKETSYEFVFTVNYFAVISDVCHELSVPYVSWSCDNPLISMYHESVFNDTNLIFLFDYVSFHEFKEMGVKNINYLPLCVDCDRIQHILNNGEDLDSYKNEISFVGSLYERNTYDRIEPELSDYLRGYLECYIELQSHMPGESLIDAALTVDVLTELMERFNLEKSEGSFSDLALVFSTTALGFKVARNQRIDALNMLSAIGEVSVYSNSDTSVLPRAVYRGGLDYWTEMPKVFNGSRINLNFTIPNIKSGIPLRVWDVMGSGGFLLTNRQSEMKLFFEEGKNIVTFGSYKEMMDKAVYYLNHDEERSKIAINSLEVIKKYHTYETRMKDMMGVIDKFVS